MKTKTFKVGPNTKSFKVGLRAPYLDFIDDQVKLHPELQNVTPCYARGRMVELLIDYFCLTNNLVRRVREHGEESNDNND